MQILGNFYVNYLTFLGQPNQLYIYDLSISLENPFFLDDF